MNQKQSCKKCEGNGYTVEHDSASNHSPEDGSCITCPIQVQCEDCLGTGELKQSWEEAFVEKGAELEHKRWSGWQDYFFRNCKTIEYQDEVSLVLPRELYDRWKRQIGTPYSELSEPEKESDRRETREYLPLVKQAIQTREREIVICSAIKLPDGRIYRGQRHSDCFRAIVDRGIPREEVIGEEQGFVTSTGRFVTREEGRILQDKAGINSVDKEGYRGKTLFSEDLY